MPLPFTTVCDGAGSVQFMTDASGSVPSAVAAAGLVGGFFVARRTGRRKLGGAVFAAAGAWCAREWYRARGPAEVVTRTTKR